MSTSEIHIYGAGNSEKSDGANQAFERYLPHCPGAQSVIGCIHIEHYLKIQEEKG